ncbi:hypothetical protein QWJ34_15285 [Saccharibacillus sp. CPCC 101409]|uniref:hypothetical protein n=1 Tax=Saccharibacillus sp. CPCC 101409 TaxID=3058041 RepID=UPI00267113A4|nr:hypothetical protein [Saccharibacillus sp. CPCC 101409]MDO3411128.1 hypothetical protein [Saccharibacillus sp. CPCC 101409]
MKTLMQSLEGLRLKDIPWRRLTTAYGRATQMPELIEQRRFREIASLIEHQGTLWQATPWTLLFLLRRSAGRRIGELPEDERFLYASVWEAARQHDESGEPLPSYPDDPLELLRDRRLLWPEEEDEEADEGCWMEEEPPGYDPSSFAAYFVYSRRLLEEAFPEDAAEERWIEQEGGR